MNSKPNTLNREIEAAGQPEGDHDWVQIYLKHNRPELGRMLQILKLDLCYESAKGNYLSARIDQKKVEILDCLGGYGSTILGHSNDEIKKTIFQILEKNVPIHAQASIRKASAELSYKLNNLLNSKLNNQKEYVCTFLNTGTEATEAAIKHSLMAFAERKNKIILDLERKKNVILQSTRQHPLIDKLNLWIEEIEKITPKLVALESGFHGKTAGSLCTTFNIKHKSMYSASAVQTVYLKNTLPSEDILNVFAESCTQFSDPHLGQYQLSNLAAVFVELIQGEGGIHVLDRTQVQFLAQQCKANLVPLVVDEIQTGLYRTGYFLASVMFGIDPDYLLLGKSLGAGYAKISAFITCSDLYVSDFGIVHTSTFSEDDFSSLVALSGLNELEKQSHISDAILFESNLRLCVQQIQKRFPGVVKEMRGKGWMLGVEFFHNSETAPALLDSIQKSGYSTYIFASYLLHKHQVRVAATLSQNHTLRIEPSCTISELETIKLCEALTDLCQQIYLGKIGKVLQKVLGVAGEQSDLVEQQISPSKSPLKSVLTENVPQVTFMTHLIDLDSVRDFDPALNRLPEKNLQHFMKELGPIGGSVTYHEQIIEGANGNKIKLQLNGITVSSAYFENALRSQSHAGYLKVKEAVQEAIQSGSKYIGLGQFTSIASDNGTAFLNQDNAFVTTGNSLTVGIAYRELQRSLEAKGKKLSECKVGIVGAAGNICNIYAQIIADEVSSLVLVHREPFTESIKFQMAVKSILKNSKITADQIFATHKLQYLKDCDIVISGTNSAKQLLFPEFFKDHAILLDIAVPSNVHPSLVNNQRGIEYIQGGYVQLPLNQKLVHPVCPAPNGQIFACMAETVTLALMRHQDHFSIGALSKAKVIEILKQADTVGMTLGLQKRKAVF